MENSVHKKDLGKMGEALIAQQALKRGFSVFVEFGDNSKIDLIIEDSAKKLHRVQVKVISRRESTTPNVTIVYLYKSGPGYRYEYTEDDVDWFAVVDEATDKVAWVPSSICSECTTVNLRHTVSANGQKKNIRMFDDYMEFPIK